MTRPRGSARFCLLCLRPIARRWWQHSLFAPVALCRGEDAFTCRQLRDADQRALIASAIAVERGAREVRRARRHAAALSGVVRVSQGRGDPPP